MLGTQFEVIAEGLAGPEGPVICPDGSVIVMEMRAGRIIRAWGGGKTEVVAETGGIPNGAQFGPDGALYVCNCGGEGAEHGEHGGGGRIERVDLGTGRVERLYDKVNGRPLSAPNDLVLDDSGGIWFTDFGAVRRRTIHRSGLYWCRPDGSEIREAYFGGLGYNGVGLSPDGKSLYVTGSWAGRLYRFAVEGPGRLGKEPGADGPVPEYVGSAAGESVFDSLAVTASGAVCVATIIDGGITTFRPDGETGFMPLPDRTVTNIAFGGEDMRDAYITMLVSGLLVKVRWDEPGLKLNFG
ncbi:MAG TPA: SMP-30/gluconolactonase/LRE family protein [Allosphingosinicella sp.]|nr:SMP-30/gluconolactonase/LRE family protein [Allosphingosinicella sp.]